MDLLWQVGVGNAVAAAVLAVPAALAGWIGRRPALTHALWLLVPLKLLTPPFYPLQLEWLETRPSEPASVAAATRVGESSQPLDRYPDRNEDLDAGLAQPGLAERQPDGLAEAREPVRVAEAVPDLEPTEPISWKAVVATIWVAGSVSWIGLASLRFFRFHQLLRHAEPTDGELVERTRGLAAALGLVQPPSVWVVPGRVSPMLWALPGRASLILPRDLIRRLTIEQCDALVTHELAHLRRRDHWVRVLEFLATGVFWWHPILWWARRELREAEEQCCDAWVVWALPAVVRGYALALVETVDFLSEVRPALPPVASGIGYVRDLRRRMTMIMRGATPRRLTWSGALLVLGVAAFMLPLLPTLAQSQSAPPSSRSSPEDDVKRAEEELQKARARLEQAQREKDRDREKKKRDELDATMRPGMRNDVCLRCHVNPHRDVPEKIETKDRTQNLHDKIIKLSAMAEQQRAALRDTEAQLEATLKKFEELTPSKGERGSGDRDLKRPDGPRPEKGPEGRFPPDGRPLLPGGGPPMRPGTGGPGGPPMRPGTGFPGGPAGPDDDKRNDEHRAELKKQMELGKHNQDRIQELTNQVEMLIKEMERMRKELRDRTPEKSKEVERPSGGASPDDPKRREPKP